MQVPVMTAIALAESGGNTDVVHHNSDSHSTTDYGVWQINDYWNPVIFRSGDWRNPADNARMAFAIYQEQGFRAWSVFKSGRYSEYLSQATTGAANPTPIDPTASIPNPVDGIKALTDPHTYLRVAMFIGGTVLLGMGLLMMGIDAVPDSLKNAASDTVKAQARTASRGNKVAQTVVKTATKGK